MKSLFILIGTIIVIYFIPFFISLGLGNWDFFAIFELIVLLLVILAENSVKMHIKKKLFVNKDEYCQSDEYIKLKRLSIMLLSFCAVSFFLLLTYSLIALS